MTPLPQHMQPSPGFAARMASYALPFYSHSVITIINNVPIQGPASTTPPSEAQVADSPRPFGSSTVVTTNNNVPGQDPSSNAAAPNTAAPQPYCNSPALVANTTVPGHGPAATSAAAPPSNAAAAALLSQAGPAGLICGDWLLMKGLNSGQHIPGSTGREKPDSNSKTAVGTPNRMALQQQPQQPVLPIVTTGGVMPHAFESVGKATYTTNPEGALMAAAAAAAGLRGTAAKSIEAFTFDTNPPSKRLCSRLSQQSLSPFNLDATGTAAADSTGYKATTPGASLSMDPTVQQQGQQHQLSDSTAPPLSFAAWAGGTAADAGGHQVAPVQLAVSNPQAASGPGNVQQGSSGMQQLSFMERVAMYAAGSQINTQKNKPNLGINLTAAGMGGEAPATGSHYQGSKLPQLVLLADHEPLQDIDDMLMEMFGNIKQSEPISAAGKTAGTAPAAFGHTEAELVLQDDDTDSLADLFSSWSEDDRESAGEQDKQSQQHIPPGKTTDAEANGQEYLVLLGEQEQQQLATEVLGMGGVVAGTAGDDELDLDAWLDGCVDDELLGISL